ncbi:MAG TPA: DoxX family protein [Actinomycetota bacterium]|nr:DoxX family protein [Actinomycetota bacterium]
MQRGRELLALACRLGVGAVFLWAGVVKSLDRQDAVLAVDAYRLLPRALVTPVAAALPWVEISFGLFLLVGLFVRFAGAGTAVLTLAFVVALVQAKARGLAIDCGCFGGGGAGAGVGWFDIVRDLPLLFGGLYLVLRPGQRLQLDQLLFPGQSDPLTGSVIEEAVIEGGPA